MSIIANDLVRCLPMAAVVALATIGIIHAGRLMSRSRSKPPLQPISIFAQLYLGWGLLFFVYAIRVPDMIRRIGIPVCKFPRSLEVCHAVSEWLVWAPGLMVFLMAGFLMSRLIGRFLKPRWQDPRYPAWKIDVAGLVLWGLLATALLLPAFGLTECLRQITHCP